MWTCRDCGRFRWTGQHGIGICAKAVAVVFHPTPIETTGYDTQGVFLVSADGRERLIDALYEASYAAIRQEAEQVARRYAVPIAWDRCIRH